VSTGQAHADERTYQSTGARARLARWGHCSVGEEGRINRHKRVKVATAHDDGYGPLPKFPHMRLPT
jgi:hypothetical protein